MRCRYALSTRDGVPLKFILKYYFWLSKITHIGKRAIHYIKENINVRSSANYIMSICVIHDHV